MKKIMFDDNHGLERGTLARIKNMTRRVSKELNAPDVVSISEWGIDDKGRATVAVTKSDGSVVDVYPAYQPGEVVAVAQSYKDAGISFIPCPDPQWGCTRDMSGYNNKMFVRADLMPHQIRITNVKYERLQDISDEDCLMEGIIEYAPCSECGSDLYSFDGAIGAYYSPREAFAALIDKISGKGTWEKNPWVFAYSFELIK